MLQGRDEVPILYLTVGVLLCLDIKAKQTNVRTPETVPIVKREQFEYLGYVNWIVFRHQRLTLLSISNDLTELKDPLKHKKSKTC